MLFLLPERNYIRYYPEMIVVVIIAGIRHIAPEFRNYGVAGIHIKTGFGSTFQVNCCPNIYWQTF